MCMIQLPKYWIFLYYVYSKGHPMICLCRHRGEVVVELQPICSLSARSGWVVRSAPCSGHWTDSSFLGYDSMCIRITQSFGETYCSTLLHLKSHRRTDTLIMIVAARQMPIKIQAAVPTQVVSTGWKEYGWVEVRKVNQASEYNQFCETLQFDFDLHIQLNLLLHVRSQWCKRKFPCLESILRLLANCPHDHEKSTCSYLPRWLVHCKTSKTVMSVNYWNIKKGNNTFTHTICWSILKLKNQVEPCEIWGGVAEESSLVRCDAMLLGSCSLCSEGTMIHQNTGNNSPNNMASHPTRLECLQSITLRSWANQVSYCCN
jgi:hypothetical protein